MLINCTTPQKVNKIKNTLKLGHKRTKMAAIDSFILCMHVHCRVHYNLKKIINKTGNLVDVY